jgi:hypothetical protein
MRHRLVLALFCTFILMACVRRTGGSGGLCATTSMDGRPVTCEAPPGSRSGERCVCTDREGLTMYVGRVE